MWCYGSILAEYIAELRRSRSYYNPATHANRFDLMEENDTVVVY